MAAGFRTNSPIVAVLASGAARLVTDGPTAVTVVLRERTSDSPSSTLFVTSLVHPVYGALAGGLLVALEHVVVSLLSVPPTFAEALTLAGPWSVLLFLAVVAVWRLGFGSADEGQHLAEFAAYNLVYRVEMGL